MENYIIYEEIGKGDACTVFKGRRKGMSHIIMLQEGPPITYR
jgi:hypothetical protein